MKLSECEKIRGVITSVEEIKAHSAVGIEYPSKCADVKDNKAPYCVKQMRKCYIFIYHVVVIIADGQELKWLYSVFRNIVPKVAVA